VGVLSKELRTQLARVTLAAREAAERGVRAALEHLAVHEKDYRSHMTVEARQLRNRLRARGRALGDVRDERSGTQEIGHLVDDAAYEHWHRLLFTRFLAENHLLRTDAAHGTVPVTVAECEELAPELGARDGFELACRFASEILPGVFRRDDPALELRLAPNDEVALRRLLDSLPPEIFQADDALGWTYQFWQAKRKDEVNASGKKIGADELPAVTQLFTEDYMVEFLLHNTLGAWWAGRRGPITATDEEEARRLVALRGKEGLPAVSWTYLRFLQDEGTKAWRPGAGTFDGWPKRAKDVRVLDPCMGSGHFLVSALIILARLRMEEEQLMSAPAVYDTLRDNLYGLEIDPRCTQIGAFNLALTAWKLAGWQALPSLHVACCGLAPQAKLADWVRLAGKDDRKRRGMEQLYRLFEQAPVLGSLINPHIGGGDLVEASYTELTPLLEQALADERADETAHEIAVTAQGIAKAAAILAGEFILVSTNVPYLGRGKQDDVLKGYCERIHPEAKTDLATSFLQRCIEFSTSDGCTAIVTPQNWLFQDAYRAIREKLLRTITWHLFARLGEHGFDSQQAAGAFTALCVCSHRHPTPTHQFQGIDSTEAMNPEAKSISLFSAPLVLTLQTEQLSNPKATIVFGRGTRTGLLREYASYHNGIQTGDYSRFGRCFWEVVRITGGWNAQQSTVTSTTQYQGLEHILFWEQGRGELFRFVEGRLGSAQVKSWLRGEDAWGSVGIAVSATRKLNVARYSGDLYDDNTVVIIPARQASLPAIWAFCSSDDFHKEVRKIAQNLKVRGPLVDVPFDLAHWQEVAAKKYPQGLPKPHSDDPTQWLFNGHPQGSEEPLQVAVARLLGYRWPRQTGSSFPDSPALGPDGLERYADEDGVVALPPLNREQPGVSRLRALLAAAFGREWSAAKEHDLLAAVGAEGTTLEGWLRDEFFKQHCAMFHHRPFIWHIWDGRKDGFHALVNYHRLDNATLQKLTYSYLGDWIRQQEQDAKADKTGAAERLGAGKALQEQLAKILEGDPPYDIFVRWKSLKEQPLGWQPDLNDGVRFNIRPFMQAIDVGKKGAGLLRTKPNIKWEKDRGTEPERLKADYPWFWSAEEPPADYSGGKEFKGHRWNDVHFSLAWKRRSRGK
jgi:hypothetical protein